jgi:hypothetical protein
MIKLAAFQVSGNQIERRTLNIERRIWMAPRFI